jgi:hypothetical protein
MENRGLHWVENSAALDSTSNPQSATYQALGRPRPGISQAAACTERYLAATVFPGPKVNEQLSAKRMAFAGPHMDLGIEQDKLPFLDRVIARLKQQEARYRHLLQRLRLGAVDNACDHQISRINTECQSIPIAQICETSVPVARAGRIANLFETIVSTK